jgi:S1-C subfamily serine protease
LSIDPFDQRQRVTWSVGSGVIIDDKGLILTNAHVVIELDEVYVSLGGGRLPRSSVSMRYSTWRC